MLNNLSLYIGIIISFTTLIKFIKKDDVEDYISLTFTNSDKKTEIILNKTLRKTILLHIIVSILIVIVIVFSCFIGEENIYTLYRMMVFSFLISGILIYILGKENIKNYNSLSKLYKVIIFFIAIVAFIIAYIFFKNNIVTEIICSVIIAIILPIVSNTKWLEDKADISDKILGLMFIEISFAFIPVFFVILILRKFIDLKYDYIIGINIILLSIIIAIFFSIIHNFLLSNYSNKASLAYIYIYTKTKKKFFVFQKNDEYLLCSRKSYLSCSNIEKDEFKSSIKSFSDKLDKTIFVNPKNNKRFERNKYKFDKYLKKLYYFSDFIRVDEPCIKELLKKLDDYNLSSSKNIRKCERFLKRKTKKINNKFKIELIHVDDILGQKYYRYYKNIRKFNNMFRKK